MNRPLSIALLVGGIIALIYGLSASDSVGSEFSRLFTGAPTDKTIWLLIGGGICAAVGGGGLITARKSG